MNNHTPFEVVYCGCGGMFARAAHVFRPKSFPNRKLFCSFAAWIPVLEN